MISHRLINIQISGRRSIKACQQLVHHDQQFHLFRLLDKLFFDLFFKCFWVFSTQHLHVDFVLFHRLGLAIITYGFSANIAHRRFVRSHDGALPLQLGLLEQFIEFARLVNIVSAVCDAALNGSASIMTSIMVLGCTLEEIIRRYRLLHEVDDELLTDIDAATLDDLDYVTL